MIVHLTLRSLQLMLTRGKISIKEDCFGLPHMHWFSIRSQKYFSCFFQSCTREFYVKYFFHPSTVHLASRNGSILEFSYVARKEKRNRRRLVIDACSLTCWSNDCSKRSYIIYCKKHFQLKISIAKLACTLPFH